MFVSEREREKGGGQGEREKDEDGLNLNLQVVACLKTPHSMCPWCRGKGKSLNETELSEKMYSAWALKEMRLRDRVFFGAGGRLFQNSGAADLKLNLTEHAPQHHREREMSFCCGCRRQL